MLESIDRLYKAFDSVFPRPTSFDNERCCVTEEQEKLLLSLPRHQWTEEMLAEPMDHNDGCFGTFEEVSYLVPRLMEILSESDEGFEQGLLEFSFFGFLLRREADYRQLGLWGAIEDAITEVFRSRTAIFAVTHYDTEACRRNGWCLEYLDLVAGSHMVHELLGEFCYRKALDHLPSTGLGSQEWDEVFDRWAEDGSPERVAHLLDQIKLHFEDRLLPEYCVPANFIRRLEDGLAGQLVDRAWPVISAVDSPTWLRDLLCVLEQNAGYRHAD